jgi:hypothetical protein
LVRPFALFVSALDPRQEHFHSDPFLFRRSRRLNNQVQSCRERLQIRQEEGGALPNLSGSHVPATFREGCNNSLPETLDII